MKINKNQVGDGIFTSDNLVAGTNISMTQETETIVSGLDEYTQLYVPFNDSLSDMSSNNCTVTQTGTPYVTYTDGKFDKALSSITASSGVLAPVKWTKSDSSKFSIENGFTLEFFQYLDTSRYDYETERTPCEVRFGDDGGSIYFQAHLGIDRYSQEPWISAKLGGLNPSISSSTISPYFVDQAWNHIAITFSPSQYVRVFFNGHKIYEYTGSDWTSLINLGSSYDGVTINSDGSSLSGGRDAKFDELRLSNTVRYTGDFTPPTAPFGAVTQIDVTKINNTQDISSKANVSLDNLSSAGKSLAAGLGMPAIDANNWVQLTLGASGTIYTMPEDGLVCFHTAGGTLGGYIQLYGGNSANLHLASQTYEVLRTFLFVPKGYNFGVSYESAGTLGAFGYYKLKGNAN